MTWSCPYYVHLNVACWVCSIEVSGTNLTWRAQIQICVKPMSCRSCHSTMALVFCMARTELNVIHHVHCMDQLRVCLRSDMICAMYETIDEASVFVFVVQLLLLLSIISGTAMAIHRLAYSGLQRRSNALFRAMDLGHHEKARIIKAIQRIIFRTRRFQIMKNKIQNKIKTLWHDVKMTDERDITIVRALMDVVSSAVMSQ